jgi:hypothetical protein
VGDPEHRSSERPDAVTEGGQASEAAVRGPIPATSVHDAPVLQILTAEHSSLAAARSLAYNEAFTRGDMFLSFLSFSFVGLALVAQAVPIDRDFLLIAALVLAFDFVVGLTSYGRVVGANYEDYLAVYGMARIRHGYSEIAPVARPYLTTSVHDDLAGVMVSYGSPPTRGLGLIVYQLTTSSGMIALIVSLIGGALAIVVALVVGSSVGPAFVVGAVVALAVLLALAGATIRFYARVQSRLSIHFPTPVESRPAADESRTRETP